MCYACVVLVITYRADKSLHLICCPGEGRDLFVLITVRVRYIIGIIDTTIKHVGSSSGHMGISKVGLECAVETNAFQLDTRAFELPGDVFFLNSEDTIVELQSVFSYVGVRILLLVSFSLSQLAG